MKKCNIKVGSLICFEDDAYHMLYIDNTVQSGIVLMIYYDEKFDINYARILWDDSEIFDCATSSIKLMNTVDIAL